MSRLRPSHCLLPLLALAIVAAGAPAALPPLPGVFEGVYWQDPWGVGHFRGFLVPPQLHATIAPFEGKRIRVDVTEVGGRHAGPPVVGKVGRIDRLPEPDLQI